MIITISRQFGSGGKELGKRLAVELKLNFFDNEIITAVAKNGGFSREYVENASEKGITSLPITSGKTFFNSFYLQSSKMEVFIKQQQIIKEIGEKGNCVIVGRAADYILREKNTFNIFVYADLACRIARCRDNALPNEQTDDRRLAKEIKKIDEGRRRFVSMVSGKNWGEKENYHLLLNTTDCKIEGLVKPLANYIKEWFSTSEN